MRARLGVVLAVLGIAAVALAQNLVGVTYYPTWQSSPEGLDCSDAGFGLDLSQVSGWQVVAATDGGTRNTYGAYFRGDGTLQCYYCAAASYPTVSGGPVYRRWGRCNPASAYDLTVDGGAKIAIAGQFVSSVGAGKVYYWPNKVFVVESDAGVHDGGFYITLEGRKGFPK
jgi:hypothetical protein